jgi:Na+/H+ antiporter NhaC
MAATLGVATFRYLPFTFFNLLSVVIALVMGFAGVRMLRLEEERVAPAPASSVSG